MLSLWEFWRKNLNRIKESIDSRSINPSSLSYVNSLVHLIGTVCPIAHTWSIHRDFLTPERVPGTFIVGSVLLWALHIYFRFLSIVLIHRIIRNHCFLLPCVFSYLLIAHVSWQVLCVLAFEDAFGPHFHFEKVCKGIYYFLIPVLCLWNTYTFLDMD